MEMLSTQGVGLEEVPHNQQVVGRRSQEVVYKCRVPGLQVEVIQPPTLLQDDLASHPFSENKAAPI